MKATTSTFQTFIVLSHEPVYNISSLIATVETGPLCPRKTCPISLVYLLAKQIRDDAAKLTRLARAQLSPVKRRGRPVVVGPEGSMANVRIFDGRTRGFPFLLLAFKRRFVRLSRDAVV